jgi:ApaG protein
MDTTKIHVATETHFLADQSSAENARFIWSYDITITNESGEIVQLLNRYWRITDMRGKVEEVKGVGVIGLQPLIQVNKQFAYSSFCQLTTPQGFMEGHYEVQRLNEEVFVIEIPKFELISASTNGHPLRSMLH